MSVFLKIFVVGCVSCWPGWLGAWTSGTYPVGSSGFTVDGQNRNDVVSFWQGVYQASEGYWDRCAWSGNYTAVSPYTNAEGGTSGAFVTDVERRLNFYRALCQVPATAHLNTGATVSIDPYDPTNLYTPTTSPSLAASTTKAAAAQRSAYMIIRTYSATGNSSTAMNHNPLQASCTAWTTTAWNANHYGNLAFTYYGPAAVDSYLGENALNADAAWNLQVGHRRWALYPPSTDFASGDTPGAYDPVTNTVWPPTNVLYVVPKTSEKAVVAPAFVAYPAAGFFPAPLNSSLWSLSYPGAVFDTASVTMTTAVGVAVPLVIQARGGSYGDPAIVWQVSGDPALTAVNSDTKYNVTVAGISGSGVPSSYTYSVTLINPNQITSDQSLFGASAPSTTASTIYQLTPPAKAEAIQVNCFQPLSTAWSETAEDSPTPGVIASTAASYTFRSTCSFAGFGPISGAKSFRLTFPVYYDARLNGVPSQSFDLGRELLPGASATLNFKYRRGYMSLDTCLVVELSNDGGVTWTQQGAAITGNTSGSPDVAVPSPIALALSTSTVPVRVRFRLGVPAGRSFYADQKTTYDYTTIPTGIFIDDISTTNCQWLNLTKTNDLAATATSFVLNSTSAGMSLTNNLALRLRLRTKLGNVWMPYGPMKGLLFSTGSVASTPTLNPVSGVYAAGQPITITAESGSTIYYRLNGGTEASAASPLGGLCVPTDASTLTISAYAKVSGKADSANVSGGFAGSPLMTWTNTYFPGITDSNIVSLAADPDHDGQTNLIEFALGGNPTAAGSSAKLNVLSSDGISKMLLLTITVRAGTPDFTGTPSPAATQDGVIYTVQGGLSLAAFTSPVSAVVPAVTTGLPAAPAGYEYRSFKLDAADGLPGSGFLRVQVATSP